MRAETDQRSISLERTIAFGPDDMLYISVGSTCNACNESNQENATLLRASPDGKSRTIFAKGLRNTFGFAWHLETGELWAWITASTFSAMRTAGGAEQDRGGKAVWLAARLRRWGPHSVPVTLGYTAHAAPMQMVFASGAALPAVYKATLSLRCAVLGIAPSPPAMRSCASTSRTASPRRFEPFVTGFLTDGAKSHIARPVGLATAIAYTGLAAARETTASLSPPAEAIKAADFPGHRGAAGE